LKTELPAPGVKALAPYAAAAGNGEIPPLMALPPKLGCDVKLPGRCDAWLWYEL
jgi:hypothetical protein